MIGCLACPRQGKVMVMFSLVRLFRRKAVDDHGTIAAGYIVAGLGNPGERYHLTRHNVGFRTVDILSEKWGFVLSRHKHKALFGEGRINGHKVILAKPQTYMNRSGESILDMVSYYKLPLNNLIIIYDDVDIQLGKIRVRPRGSAGTHNGMRSVIYQLQDDDFPRVRIGIGPKPAGMDMADFVLSGFGGEEERMVHESLMRAAEAVDTIIRKGCQEAMNRFNG
jgi:PTH1 family peptidyl-tRNA hydrolase